MMFRTSTFAALAYCALFTAGAHWQGRDEGGPAKVSRGAAVDADKPADFVRLMNLGKAYLENREAANAIKVLSQAVELRSKSAAALRNLARAYWLTRKLEPALEVLAKAARLETESVATSYLTGLTHVRLSKFDQAVPHFEAAIRLDPHTATLRYQLAGAYQAVGQHDEAIQQLRETVRLDPLHASAHFKLGAYARKAGDREESQRRTREFMRLRKLFGDETRSAEALEQCIYTLPEAAVIDAAPDRARQPRAIDVCFTDVTDEVFAGAADRAAAAAVIDVDETGRSTIFVADTGGNLGLLKMSAAGTFQRTAIDLRGDRPSWQPLHVVTGNFHDDVPEGARYDAKVHVLTDVLLSGPDGVCLLKRTGPLAKDGFRDVTESAGLAGITARRALWVDYEHDGDLDLLMARATGLELWQNNGNGRFENVTVQVGISETGAVSDVAAVDLDANVAVDLIAVRETQPTLVFENQRAGRFAPMPEPPGPWPTAKRVLANDVNNDGHADAVLLADNEAVVLLGRSTNRPRIDLSGLVHAAAAPLDYDNDG